MGGTGRDDEAPVGVPVAVLSQLIPDIAQAGRFAATHRDRIPHADLHNVVADALSAIGAALRQGDGRSIPVPGYHCGSRAERCSSSSLESRMGG